MSEKKKTCYMDRTSDHRFYFDFMDNELTVGAVIQYTCKKPLSMYNLISLTESVNRKVPSGFIYTRNNLLHLDPGLFQY